MEESVLLVGASASAATKQSIVAGHQYAKANIPNTEFYDSSQPESCILATDAVNLYGEYLLILLLLLTTTTTPPPGWCMGKPLATGNFQWVRGDHLKKFSDPNYILQLDSHASKGYFLEVKYYYYYYYYYYMDGGGVVAGGPGLRSKSS